MASIDKDKAYNLMLRMKIDMLELLNKYSTEASLLAVNSTDPHSPIIAFAQMALANGSADYMKLCGATPQECFQITVNITGTAMQQWIDSVIKKNSAKPIVDVEVQPNN